MKFETAAQQACYEKIAPWLQEQCDDVQLPPDGTPAFVLRSGSTAAVVEVLPWREGEAIVSTWSYVVTGAHICAELLEFLLLLNGNLNFGGFSLDEDHDIRFHATLIGSTCDRKELQAIVCAVLETADRYDDEIVALWGGQRALDRARQLGQPTEHA